MGEDSQQELHELNPTGRFSDRVADYVRARQSYPAEAIAAMLDGLTLPVVAADVGAGTGISARLLAERVMRVIAIEPNGPMREAADSHPLIEWRYGTAEATGLGEASVDLVMCAQAFHWFRPQEALAEFARIVKPGGRLAVMWNKRDNRDPLTDGYSQAIVECCEVQAAEERPFDPELLVTGTGFEERQNLTFANTHQLNEENFLRRATSASYVPNYGPDLDALLSRLRALFVKYAEDGVVTMRYRTEVHLAIRV
jgi:SAM-dependent methyltransferase